MTIMRELMPFLQESNPTTPSPLHVLGPGQACTLAPAPHARHLLVADGSVWVTGIPTDERGGDLWLWAGESALIPAGAAPVVEGAPEVRFIVMEQRNPWVQAFGARLRSWLGRTFLGATRWLPVRLAV